MDGDPIGSQLLLQLILILINAFFAATETAVVSLNENKIKKQAESGDAKAVQLLKMVESPKISFYHSGLYYPERFSGQRLCSRPLCVHDGAGAA